MQEERKAEVVLLLQIPRDDDALLTLGSAAQGPCECIVGVWAAQSKPAQSRVAKGKTTMACMREVLVVRVRGEADHDMWCTLVQSAARALGYDYRM